MFTLTIQVSSIEEAERVLAVLKNPADVGAAEVQGTRDVAVTNDMISNGVPSEFTSGTATTPKKRGRPSKAANESAAPVAESGSAAVAPATEQSASEPVVQLAQQTLSIDDARNALKDVQTKYGTADMAKPLELLGQFGANRISEVEPEKYAEFIAACKAA